MSNAMEIKGVACIDLGELASSSIRLRQSF